MANSQSLLSLFSMTKNNPSRELFIAFEGIDGSGKSSQIQFLADRITRQGKKVYPTCEPTDGRIGKMIRDIFQNKEEGDHHTIAGLFVADRLHHLLNKKNGILQQLETGHTVLTDRYVFSSYAYQGAHVDLEWVIAANAESQRILQPDLHVFLDISVDTAMDRLTKNREHMELFETRENLIKVQKIYYQILDRFKEEQNILIVNGEQSMETIAKQVWEAVKVLFEEFS